MGHSPSLGSARRTPHSPPPLLLPAGFTDITVGLVNTHYVFMPIPTIIQAPRKVNPSGRRWNRLITSLSQPDLAPSGV